MAAKAFILHRDHRGFHDVGDLVNAQPFAIARPKRHDYGAVRGVNTDHLPVG